MIDRYIHERMQKPLIFIALKIQKTQITPNQVSLIGKFFGLIAMILIINSFFILALIFILINRVFDGVDGALARLTNKTTPYGAFFDIVCDYVIYAGVVLAFALNNLSNALAVSVLLFSFTITGVSFLAKSATSKKIDKANTAYAKKGFFYHFGIAEGFETIVFLSLICFFPFYFNILSYAFSAICGITVVQRFLTYQE